MNLKTKTFAALTALTLAATFALPTTQAEAKYRGWGIGAGIVGAGIIAGSIAAAHAGPVYVVGPRCRYVDRFDRWGNYAGTVKVCNRYY
jgi:hypothetical protein